jgi:hypothetical protein
LCLYFPSTSARLSTQSRLEIDSTGTDDLVRNRSRQPRRRQGGKGASRYHATQDCDQFQRVSACRQHRFAHQAKKGSWPSCSHVRQAHIAWLLLSHRCTEVLATIHGTPSRAPRNLLPRNATDSRAASNAGQCINIIPCSRENHTSNTRDK